MFDDAKEFSQDSTGNTLLSRPSNLVLTLSYYHTPNERIRVKSVAVIILIQQRFMRQQSIWSCWRCKEV